MTWEDIIKEEKSDEEMQRENRENYKEILYNINLLKSVENQLERAMDESVDEQINYKELAEISDLLSRATGMLQAYYSMY